MSSARRQAEGGNVFQAYGDGASYDPGTGSWTVLPAAPLSARCGQSGIWTGREFIIWGLESRMWGLKARQQ